MNRDIVIEIPTEVGGGSSSSTDNNKTIERPIGSFYDISNKPTKAESRALETESSLYLYSFNRKEQIHLKLVPQSVSTTHLPRYTSQSPYASARPINFYVGGTSKRISFTIDLHEQDKASVRDGESVYDLVEKLKGFSIATQGKKRVEDPLIYLQIGGHFAGKGHLETQIEYRLPIREGRYQHIVVGFTFTYHEEYEETEIYIPVLDQVTATFTDLVITTTGDYKRVAYEPINKYFEGEVENSEFFVDYVVKSIYEDKKLEKILNVAEVISDSLYVSTRQWVILNAAGKDFNFFMGGNIGVTGSDETSEKAKAALNSIRAGLSVALEMVEFFMSGDFKVKYRINRLETIQSGVRNLYDKLMGEIIEAERDKEGFIFVVKGVAQPVARKWLEEISYVIQLIDSIIQSLINISGAGI